MSTRTHNIALLTSILVIFFIYYFGSSSDNFYVVSDIVNILTAALAVFFGFIVVKKSDTNNIQGKALLFIFLAAVLWMLAESAWGYYEIGLGIQTPETTVADLLWYLGYFSVMIGFHYIWKIIRPTISKLRNYISFLVSTATFFISSVFVYYDTFSPERSLIDNIVINGYVVFDLTLIVVGILTILSFRGGNLAKPWAILAASIIIMLIPDFIYSKYINTFNPADLYTILWSIGYLLMAFSFHYYSHVLDDMKAHSKNRKNNRKNA